MVNDGIGGKEDVNEDNPPRTNVLYEETGALEKPEDLEITAPAGKSFAGWSTAPLPTTGKLYKPGVNVSAVVWETPTPLPKWLQGRRAMSKNVCFTPFGAITSPGSLRTKRANTGRWYERPCSWQPDDCNIPSRSKVKRWKRARNGRWI